MYLQHALKIAPTSSGKPNRTESNRTESDRTEPNRIEPNSTDLFREGREAVEADGAHDLVPRVAQDVLH